MGRGLELGGHVGLENREWKRKTERINYHSCHGLGTLPSSRSAYEVAISY